MLAALFSSYLAVIDMNACEFPPELLCRPLAVIMLYGLNIEENQTHRNVWQAFLTISERSSKNISFRLITDSFEIPICKPKPTTYQWYMPKGIIKRNWMKKHLCSIPSVVVVFFDLEWDDPDWKVKQVECESSVNKVKQSLHNRNTKIVLILLQKKTIPPGLNQLASTRATELCDGCDLTVRALFVINVSDHLAGYVARLENEFDELAQNYYQTATRRVRSYRTLLSKTNHSLLFIRHAFKVAFFFEMKRDIISAIRYYKQAYNHTLEALISNTNVIEIKTVAGFINYKICKLSFQQYQAVEAIEFFKRHINFFKEKRGDPALYFEHYAWLSKQFSIFAELFEEALKCKITAIQVPHPGFYYQEAANYAMIRRDFSHTHCHSMSDPPFPNPLADFETMEFYGQRPWRQGNQSIEPPDIAKEEIGIKCLQHEESLVNFSAIIIPLLSAAVSKFGQFHSTRMERCLKLQLGEEYSNGRDYSKALKYFLKVLPDYRRDPWPLIISHLLFNALHTAYMCADVEQYSLLALELLGPSTQIDEDKRLIIYANLQKIFFESCAPQPLKGVGKSESRSLLANWENALSRCNSKPIILDITNIPTVVTLRSCFSQESFSATEKVTLNVFVKIHLRAKISFSKLAVHFSKSRYDCSRKCEFHDWNSLHNIQFQFYPNQEDIGENLEIVNVELLMGNEEQHKCLTLRWSRGYSQMNLIESVLRAGRLGSTDNQYCNIKDVIERSSTKLRCKNACSFINFVHKPPVLINELYNLEVIINSEEAATIKNMVLKVHLDDGDNNAKMYFAGEPEIDANAEIAFNFQDTLEPHNTVSVDIVLQVMQPGLAKITFDFLYNVDVVIEEDTTLQCSCVKSDTLSLSVIKPFDISSQVCTLAMEPLDTLHASNPCILISSLLVVSPHSLDIKDASFELSEPSVTKLSHCPFKHLLLCQNESFRDLCLVETMNSAEPTTLNLGLYKVTWRRHTLGSNSLLYSTSYFDVAPAYNVDSIPISVEADFPSFGYILTPIPVEFIVTNRSESIQEIQVTMHSSDCIKFSGNHQIHVYLLPGDKRTLNYTFVPISVGYLTIPQLSLYLKRSSKDINNVVKQSVPRQIFVKPRHVQSALLNA